MNTSYDPYGRIEPGRRRYLVITLIVWIVVMSIWFFYVPKHISPLKLPGPSDVVAAQSRLGWGLLSHSLATLVRVILGFLIGCSLGVVCGFLLFGSKSFEATTFSFIEVIRPIPPIALTPFFIFWFQLSPTGQIALIGLGCFMVCTVSTHETLGRVNIDLRRAAYSLGTRGVVFYWHVLLPTILPQLVGPLRVSLALAFALATAAEFMGAQSGIGFLMMVARRTLHTDVILLGIIILGIESAVLDWMLRLLVRTFTRWQ